MAFLPWLRTSLPAEQKQGWELLFDGTTSKGWLEVTGKPFPGQARARGLEYQLAGEHERDAVSDPTRFAGSLYSIIAPSPKIIPLIGSFNHSRLLVKGDHVEHWLNGARVVEFEIMAPEVQSQIRKMVLNGAADAPIARDTPISLQNHSSEVWIRNIKIRRLE